MVPHDFLLVIFLFLAQEEKGSLRMVLPEVTVEASSLIGQYIPTNTGPIRESFIQHSEAEFEQRMTSFVYGGFTTYILYYLIS